MVNVPQRTGLNRRLSAGRDGNFDGLLGVWTFITVFTTALAFGFAFGFALRTAVGVLLFGNGGQKKDVSKGSAIIGSLGPMDGTSGSGAGGSSRGASLRVSKGDDIVLVDSAVGAAMLVSGAAIVVRLDSPIGADNVRTAVPGAEGDIEPLLADGRSESVAAGKA